MLANICWSTADGGCIIAAAASPPLATAFGSTGRAGAGGLLRCFRTRRGSQVGQDAGSHQQCVAALVELGKCRAQLTFEELEQHDADARSELDALQCSTQSGRDGLGIQWVVGTFQHITTKQAGQALAEQFQAGCMQARQALGQLFVGQLLFEGLFRDQGQGLARRIRRRNGVRAMRGTRQ